VKDVEVLSGATERIWTGLETGKLLEAVKSYFTAVNSYNRFKSMENHQDTRISQAHVRKLCLEITGRRAELMTHWAPRRELKLLISNGKEFLEPRKGF